MGLDEKPVDVGKLAKWADFKEFADYAGQWSGPQDREGHSHYLGSLPSFRSSLDACFKHLEPPLRERLGIYYIGFGKIEGTGYYTCYMYRKAIEWPYRYEGRSKELSTIGSGQTLGAAFCDAALQAINKYPELEKIVEQVMDKEEK